MAPNKIIGETFRVFQNNGIDFKVLGKTEIATLYPKWENQMLRGLDDAKCYRLTDRGSTLYLYFEPDDGECQTMKLNLVELD